MGLVGMATWKKYFPCRSPISILRPDNNSRELQLNHCLPNLVKACIACFLLVESISMVRADNKDIPVTGEQLSEVTVRASRVANTQPAGTYASLATNLRFDPQTELQSRGLPEGQADVSVRGGIFENTGFAVGAVTVMDPQTGHYTAGLPIEPRVFIAS